MEWKCRPRAYSAWYVVGYAKGTPVEIIERLNSEINAILDQMIRRRLKLIEHTPFRAKGNSALTSRLAP